MAVLDHTDTLKNLKRKGFKECESKSKDHIWVEFWYNNKATKACTKLSRNKQAINDFLITKMAKQVCLTRSKFIDLAKCPLSEAEFVKLLKEQGVL